MDFLGAVTLVVAILGGAFAATSVAFNILCFVGFMGWASFFAAGGKLTSFKTSLIPNLSGVFWGFIIMQLSGLLGSVMGPLPALFVAVAIGAAGMCYQGKINLLSFTPGTFIGCAAYFGSNYNGVGTIIGLVCGAVLGYVSEAIALKLSKPEETEN